ncbi:S-adenosylmethionine sensor upstream of mTORC1 [Tribolium castaneum]|uniref:S-adenosylmethionine sensor upstream of mTORC1 n=1 Tax=Tribolium castaneum TaxID=7070 RepID=D6WEG1_TRICA|nr:PREDICTED: probable methyltransferase BTM2 homolog [Tribolium castaneum]EFA00405.1 putative methyltransferase BTM2 homolog-like Protein [Tribolium castaneum]|eukprot:XP_972782.1 PREDICTED: probable methyltransferase BTM2 homolog [Tribolium castaneum]
MATSEHLQSANFVKSVHQKLRSDAKIMGAGNAWRRHCENGENLAKYASAMQNLATNHWEKTTNSRAVSRVEWVHSFCLKYFHEEIFKQRQREVEIATKLNLKVPDLVLGVKNQYELLDVGSCFNPFAKYQCFSVTPIDIAPATSDVLKCDFLNVDLTSNQYNLQKNSFDVVVFSLLLEYLPSPDQRHTCCEKAYNLLRPEGILLIITPDSKHVGANAKIMKSWRFILAKMGFSRIKYEKLAYLHCMAFRKSIKSEIAQRWALLQIEKPFYEEIVIPQDFNKIETPTGVVCDSGDNCEVSLFEELPQSFE